MSIPPESQRPRWEWANIGFNTMSKLWFIELYNFMGLVETFQAKQISVKGGSGVQYQWPEKGKPVWHVRERIFVEDFNRLEYAEDGTLVVEYAIRHPIDEEIPENFDSISYAYSLSDARGFVEFRDKDNAVIKKIDGRWIAVENLARKTEGEYPNIRLTAKREDIVNIVVTNTTIVIVGKG